MRSRLIGSILRSRLPSNPLLQSSSRRSALANDVGRLGGSSRFLSDGSVEVEVSKSEGGSDTSQGSSLFTVTESAVRR